MAEATLIGHNKHPNAERTASKISEALSTPEFLQDIRRFPSDDRGYAIGHSVEYFALGLNETGLKAHLSKLLKLRDEIGPNWKHETHKLLVDDAAEMLGQDLSTEQGNDAVMDYIYQQIGTDGFVYHGFNGTFQKDIEEHGLSATKRKWDKQELEKITEILSPAGHGMALGWMNIQAKDNIFVATETAHLYTYATVSPEWFGQFTSEGWHIKLFGGYDKHAFEKRDHAAARKNIELFCDEISSRDPAEIAAGRAYPNITAEERDTILHFFEKYWRELAGPESGPKVALIPRKTIGWDESTEWLEALKDSPNINAYSMYHILSNHNDARIGHDIPASDIFIANLPDYNLVHPSGEQI